LLKEGKHIIESPILSGKTVSQTPKKKGKENFDTTHHKIQKLFGFPIGKVFFA
jgi:hypothetical protein